MNVITQNDSKTPALGIVTDVQGLTTVGDFQITLLEEWVKQIKMVFGEGDEGCIRIQFKLADDPDCKGYAITASLEGHDPHIMICGMCRPEGKEWE